MPPRLRKVLFWIHLTVGLTLALPVFVMCVTGFLLTYERQIDAWVDHSRLKSQPPAAGAPALGVEALIRGIQQARGGDPDSITVFSDSARPLEAQMPGKPPRTIYVDAYSGMVLGEPSRDIRRLFQKVRAWHLALAVSGPHHDFFRGLIKASNAVTFVLVFFGILLWIPRRWTWQHLRGIVTLRFGLAGRARDFNWHHAFGIWSVGPLLIILWAAMALSYGWARQLTDRMMVEANGMWGGPKGAEAVAPRTIQENEPGEAPSVTLDGLLTRAKAQMPGWKAITLLVPRPDSRQVYFTIDTIGDGIRELSALGLDQSGRVASFVPAGSGGIFSPNLIRYGHTGEAWGIAGQTIAGVASLCGAVLVWTGLALSLRRFRLWLGRKVTAAGAGTSTFHHYRQH